MMTRRKPLSPSSEKQPGRKRRHRGAESRGGWLSDPPGSRILPLCPPREPRRFPVPSQGAEGKVRCRVRENQFDIRIGKFRVLDPN